MADRVSNAVASLAAAVTEKEEELRIREAAVAAGEQHIGARFSRAASAHIMDLEQSGIRDREDRLDQQATILDGREAELAARESAWATEQSNASWHAKKLKDAWCAACRRRVPYGEYFFCYLCNSGGCRCSLAPTQGHWWCAGCEHDASDSWRDWHSGAAEVPQSSVQAPAMTQRIYTPPTPPPPQSSTPSSASTPLAEGRRVKAPPPPQPAQSLPSTPQRPMSLGPARDKPELAKKVLDEC